MRKAALLEVVWRNPTPYHRRQRWEQINRDSETAHYLVQELVSSPIGPFWITTSNLEFVPGGRAA